MAGDSGVGLATVIVTVTKHLTENLEERFLLACGFLDSGMQSWTASCLARPMGRQNAMATEQQGVAGESSLWAGISELSRRSLVFLPTRFHLLAFRDPTNECHQLWNSALTHQPVGKRSHSNHTGNSCFSASCHSPLFHVSIDRPSTLKGRTHIPPHPPPTL